MATEEMEEIEETFTKDRTYVPLIVVYIYALNYMTLINREIYRSFLLPEGLRI